MLAILFVLLFLPLQQLLTLLMYMLPLQQLSVVQHAHSGTCSTIGICGSRS